MSDRLAGRIALVTGAASGIGLAVTERLVADGAHVIGGDIDDAALAALADRFGDAVTPVHCDVTSEPSLAALAALAAERGGLDIAVANAGKGAFGMIVDHPLETWKEIIDLCLTGVFLTIKHAALVMNEGGSIINIASLNAIQPSAGMSAYCAAKAGVVMLTQVAAMELGARRIRVNAIGPGLVETNATSGFFALPGVVEEFVENTTVGRFAQPADVANLAAFLAGDESTFISGSFHQVDGGASTKRYPDLPGAFAAIRGAGNRVKLARTGERLPPAYWRLWTASTISNLGDGVFMVALPLLAARLTRSEISISLVAAAASLPWLILSLPIGAIIDRSDRKRILVVADSFRALVIAVLAVLAGTGNAEIWMLWIAALGLGVAEVFFDNSSQALVPAVVPPHLLERANGRRYAAELAANTFIGTPIGSLLFAVTVWLPFGLDAATFVLAVLLILPIRGSFRARPAPEDETTLGGGRTTLRQETRDGLRWLWQFPLLRSLALALGLSNLGFQLAQAVFVLFAQERLGISERAFGLLLGVMGVGAVIGALLGERIAKTFGQSGAIYAALITWTLTLALTGLYPVTWFVALMAAIESMAATAWNVVTVSLRQQVVPPHLFGRVNSVYRWFGWGTLPIGSAIGGQIAYTFGLRAPYFVGAGFVVIAILVSVRHVNARSIAAAMAAVATPAAQPPTDRTPAPPSMT